jgi:hypothetical protein
MAEFGPRRIHFLFFFFLTLVFFLVLSSSLLSLKRLGIVVFSPCPPLHGPSAMYTISKILLLLSVALSVTAIPSHYARDSRAHYALAARRPSAEPPLDPAPVAAQPRVIRKRSSGSCVPRNSSSVAASPSSTSLSAPSPSSSSAASLAGNLLKPTPSTSSTTSIQAAPSPTTPSSGSGQTFTGDGTFYATGLGACGIVNTDSDFIAAVAEGQFDTFP